MMWPSAFFLFTFFLFLLPLLPGLLELKLASDAKPLRVIQEYDTDITYFAAGFKQYIGKHFADFLSDSNKAAVPFDVGNLGDRNNFQIIHDGENPLFDKKESKLCHTSRLIIAKPSLELPEKFFFEKEIYSASSITTGEHSQFRALLAEGNIILGKSCTVLRWVHSADSLAAGNDCKLYGRASAENIMYLGEHCQFERIHAAKILFGLCDPSDNEKNETSHLTNLDTLPNVKNQFGNRWLVDGDIVIPAQRFFEGDLVASGNITISEGAYIYGSLKSNHDLILEKNVRITGAVFSAGNIHIAEGCHITGPVIAEGTLVIGSGSVIGLEQSPTTISAPIITIISGVTVYGTVWADERAQMIARQSA